MVSAHAKSLPADDLIAKNICPVKKEYVKGDLPRQTVDEVRTSAGKGIAGKGKPRSKVRLREAVCAAGTITVSHISDATPHGAGEERKYNSWKGRPLFPFYTQQLLLRRQVQVQP